MHWADRTRRPRAGADRVPDSRHMRVPHDRDALPRVHADGARRTGLEDHRLRFEGRRPLLRDALAEDASMYALICFWFLLAHSLRSYTQLCFLCPYTSIFLQIVFSITSMYMYACLFAATPALFSISKFFWLWGRISFNLAVLINVLVAIYYPFTSEEKGSSFTRNMSILRAWVMNLLYRWILVNALLYNIACYIL